jgi:hypothetical protein
MLQSPCCVRYEQDDHADRPQLPAIVRLGRFCAPVPSPWRSTQPTGPTLTRLAGCAHDSGHESVDCRWLPTAFLRQALNRRASQITRGEAGRMPFRDNEQGRLAHVRRSVGTAADSSNDSNTSGLRQLCAADSARGSQVTDGYERL